jgi:16S rRNA (guanine(966)-N(2))-methyltransferase RsmD
LTRIIAGVNRGRRLATPAGRNTRPTSDRVREALFSTLGSLTDLSGSRFADLYAGSGAVGLEAASRGAEHVLLVEADSSAARAARANIGALDAAEAVVLTVAPVQRVVAQPAAIAYDMIFADPPYELDDGQLAAVLDAVAGGWLAPDGVIAVERSSRSGPPPWPPEIIEVQCRRYGETTLWYGRRS